MDYEGQRLSELIFYWVILLFGGVGWIIGYARQDFFIVFQFWLVGVAISAVVRIVFPAAKAVLLVGRVLSGLQVTAHLSPCVRVAHHFLLLIHFLAVLQACVPDWPIYNRHPIKWLDSVPDRRGDKATSSE